MIRRRISTVTDDELELVAGGEIKVTAAIVGAGVSAVAVVAGGIAVATTVH
jgi:lactobin A/cerein 7B family class IIb bacteriocin